MDELAARRAARADVDVDAGIWTVTVTGPEGETATWNVQMEHDPRMASYARDLAGTDDVIAQVVNGAYRQRMALLRQSPAPSP